jgi:hypothetical protein
MHQLSRTRRAVDHGAWLLLLSALGCAKPMAPQPPAGPTLARSSDAATRESVSVTVYNSNFGVVRETRRCELGKGRVSLSFADVSAHIEPQTVHIRGLDQPDALRVLEQNYRYDLITPDTLLKKYVGKQLKVARYNEKLGQDEILPAELLAVENGPVLRIAGEVVTGFPGRFIFPSLPDNLVAKPTLVWLLGSTLERQRVEVSYLTSAMTWRADYVLVLSDDDTRGDLNGWVTLDNQSGTSFENAELKLVAGDVQRVTPPQPQMQEMVRIAADAAPMAEPAPGFRQESLFEYHLYTLERPTDLLDKEQKQVSLLEAHGATLEKRLLLRGLDFWYGAKYDKVLEDQKVEALVTLWNKKENQLGMPLPKGTVRVYKADKSGALQFVGEDAIDHTPEDEKVEIKLGNAFDIVADQTQTDYRRLSKCVSETAWKVALRNHKDTSESVDVEEPVSGDFEVVESSHPAKKKDAHTLSFELPVPARGTVELTYRVRVTSC